MRCELDHVGGGVCLTPLQSDGSCPLAHNHTPADRHTVPCIFCGMEHDNGTACPDVDPPRTRWDQ